MGPSRELFPRLDASSDLQTFDPAKEGRNGQTVELDMMRGHPPKAQKSVSSVRTGVDCSTKLFPNEMPFRVNRCWSI